MYLTHKFNIILKAYNVLILKLFTIPDMELHVLICFSSDFSGQKIYCMQNIDWQSMTPCCVFLYPWAGDKHFSWTSRSNNLQSDQFLIQVCRLYLVVWTFPFFTLKQFPNSLESVETLLNTSWKIFLDWILWGTLLIRKRNFFLELIHFQKHIFFSISKSFMTKHCRWKVESWFRLR